MEKRQTLLSRKKRESIFRGKNNKRKTSKDNQIEGFMNFNQVALCILVSKTNTKL